MRDRWRSRRRSSSTLKNCSRPTPQARVRVCATDCRTLTAKDNGGDLGQQLGVAATDEQTPIDLTATVTTSKRRSVSSTLGVNLTKRVSKGVCGNIQYVTDVHLDQEGNLKPGRS